MKPEDGIGSTNRQTPQHFAALQRRRELGFEPPAPDTNEDKEMFAGNSVGSVNDLDNVLRILELIGNDVAQIKGKAQHVRELAIAFEKLAADQTAFAKERAKAAEVDKALIAREAALVDREAAVRAAQESTANLEADLRRRLQILRVATAA